ncbi:MAG: radical SAM protein, partial [Clostridia bacterium]|nr:radical SAM protein [Clostridia bacterium]
MSMSKSELRTYLTESFDLPKYRADQIFDWLCRGASFEDMTNIPKALREKLASEVFCSLPTIEAKFVSKVDGTVKYLFRLYDGNLIESVVMHYAHGNSICISSEVGCNMGCRFCASTIGGMTRKLLPGEMLGQVARADFDGADISNIVMMGIGEPLDNYDNVIKFLKLVTSDDGINIGARHISLSTCGLADKIYELAKEELGITLSISLHACDDETRSSIMPVNNKWNIEKLLRACRDYFITTGRRISFEY